MTPEILLRYLHFICIFAIVGALVSEHILRKKEHSRKEIERIASMDGVYEMPALLLLLDLRSGWEDMVSRLSFIPKISYSISKSHSLRR
ncbi:DUF2214 family protein [Algoriphagus sp. C2-6-M1]|nr:DUF2214 family protein [Algoriphagus sp. C2-6-M1]MEB2781638.1 DUF2214 family protein [Algoriphagus sp. C2-6-M1]